MLLLSDWQSFHFLRPTWLLALIPLLLLVHLFRHYQRRGDAWQSVCDPKLLTALLQSHTRQSKQHRLLWQRLPCRFALREIVLINR